MTLKRWEKKVLEAPGAAAHVAEIEEELRRFLGKCACYVGRGCFNGMACTCKRHNREGCS